nr:hypothetical protein [Tanacetum cinerariifolium]
MIEEQIKNTRCVRLRRLKKKEERMFARGVKLVDRTKSSTDAGTGLFSESDGTLNDANPLKEETVVMECPIVNTPDVEPNPPLPTQEANLASNAFGKPSYATATGKPNGKKVSVRTFLHPKGRSSYVGVMIELRADVELKDNIVMAMPKITREGHYTCNNYVDAGEKKTVKKPSQTSQCVLVGPKIGFKPQKEYRPVPKNHNASSSGNKKKSMKPTIEFASNTPIGEKIDEIERKICEGKLRLSDNDRKLLVPTSIVESDSEVEVVFDETANLRI